MSLATVLAALMASCSFYRADLLDVQRPAVVEVNSCDPQKAALQYAEDRYAAHGCELQSGTVRYNCNSAILQLVFGPVSDEEVVVKLYEFGNFEVQYSCSCEGCYTLMFMDFPDGGY